MDLHDYLTGSLVMHDFTTKFADKNEVSYYLMSKRKMEMNMYGFKYSLLFVSQMPQHAEGGDFFLGQLKSHLGFLYH